LNNAGYVHFKLGESQEALDYYDKALAIDPNRTKALNNKGYILFELGRYQEAIISSERVLAINSHDSKAIDLRSKALRAINS
jgi:tetratricopeptide (TPR) repeat protein